MYNKAVNTAEFQAVFSEMILIKHVWGKQHMQQETEESTIATTEKRNPNAIGERAQGMILAEVMKYGYTVLIPFGEGRRYDMVIEKNAQFFRLQCKAGRYENGVVEFNTCSVHWWAKTGRSYSREEIDYFAVYCEHTGKVYLVPPEDVGTTAAVLRIEPTANNQVKGVRWAEDYEIAVQIRAGLRS